VIRRPGAAAARVIRRPGAAAARAIRRLLVATRLVLRVQTRAHFPHAFAVSTGLTVAVLLWAVPHAIADLVLPAFLAIELGALGLTQVAAHRYLEIGWQSASALLVSPLRPAEYLLALLLGSALLATLAGGAVFAILRGLDARFVWLLLVLFPFAVLSGTLGLLVSLRHSDFLRFILGVIPFVALWQAPLLGVYGLVPPGVVVWIPSAPALFAIDVLCRSEAAPFQLLLLSSLGGVWTVLGFGLALHTYQRRIRMGRELA